MIMFLFLRIDNSRGAGVSGGETSRRVWVGFRIHGAVKKDGPATWSFSHSVSTYNGKRHILKRLNIYLFILHVALLYILWQSSVWSNMGKWCSFFFHIQMSHYLFIYFYFKHLNAYLTVACSNTLWSNRWHMTISSFTNKEDIPLE